MKLDPVKFNIHHWNLDGLKPSKPKAEGRKSTIDLGDKLGPLRRAAAVNLLGSEEKILLLRGKKQIIIQGLDLGSPKMRITMKSWGNKEIVDMAVGGRVLYALDKTNNRIESFPLDPRDEVQPQFWNVGPIGITTHSKLALVQNDTDELPHTAYIGGGREGRLFAVFLNDNQHVGEVDVSIPTEPKTLGKELYLCPDPQNRTLLVSDTAHHRILELKINRAAPATAEVLCGTGQPGTPEEGDIAAQAPLSSPKALVLYRHQEVISDELIHEDLRAVFSYDPDRVRPRTILFVDSGSSSVKKLIDFPPQVEDLHETPSNMAVYTLLGSPQKPLLGLLPSSRKDDLRNVAVTKPIDLAVTASGELVIASETPPTLLLLRPATSLDEQTVHVKAGKLKIDFLS